MVYRAHDRHLDRLVAIKVLRTELSDAVDRQRFQKEIGRHCEARSSRNRCALRFRLRCLLEGRSAGFFCYGDGGGDELLDSGRPATLRHPDYFDPEDEPFVAG